MKTLLEQVINELKISKVSTGDKLTPILNFEDLKRGDIFYIYNIRTDTLYLGEMDSIEKGAKYFMAYIIGYVNDYKSIKSIAKYDKLSKYDIESNRYSISKTNIPLFFGTAFRKVNFIYCTSLELVNILINDKKKLDAEIAKGNTV